MSVLKKKSPAAQANCPKIWGQFIPLQGGVEKVIYYSNEVALGPIGEVVFYDVKSCLISRESYLKNKTPLWVKPTDGV